MAELQPNKLHQVLGVITFIVLLAIPVLNQLEWFNASDLWVQTMAVLFLILIGFGAIVEAIFANR